MESFWTHFTRPALPRYQNVIKTSHTENMYGPISLINMNIKILKNISKSNSIVRQEDHTPCEWSEITQLCLTLCDPMDCSLPGSSINGIFQATTLEWLLFPSPGDLPDPGIKLRSPILQADFLPLSHQRSPIYHDKMIFIAGNARMVWEIQINQCDRQ